MAGVNARRNPKGQGFLKKMKSGNYAIQFYDESGKHRQESLRDQSGNPISDRKEAEKLLRQRYESNIVLENLESKEEAIVKLMETRQMIVKSTLTFSDAWAKFHHYKEGTIADTTLKGYKSSWQTFVTYFSKKYPGMDKIGEITQEMLEGYFNDRKKMKVSAQTFNIDKITLKAVWRRALGSSSATLFADLPKIPKSEPTREPLTYDELQRTFFYLSPESVIEHEYKDEYRCMLKLMAFCGMRGGESTQLTWGAVNETFDQITFVPNKTKHCKTDPVTIPIHRELKSELLYRHSIRLHGEIYILPSLQERYHRYDGAISKVITKILQEVGIITSVAPDAQTRRILIKKVDPKTHKTVTTQRKICKKSMHSIRHYFATIALKLGIDPLVTQRILGHSTMKMTAHYTHIDDEQKREAISMFPDIYPCNTIDVKAVEIPASERETLLNEIIAALHDLPVKRLLLIKEQLKTPDKIRAALALPPPVPSITAERLSQVLQYNNLAIANIFNISDSMITRYLKQYNLPTRRSATQVLIPEQLTSIRRMLINL